MSQAVSAIAMQLHRNHLSRQARYATAAMAAQRESRLKIIAATAKMESIEREKLKERLIEMRRVLIAHEACRALVLGFRQGMNTPSTKKIFIRDIQSSVARHFHVTVNDLKASRRTANVVMTRQISMYLAKQLTLCSLPEIGRLFGGRDHTTVLHGVRKIAAMMEADEAFRAKVESLRAAVTGE
jgi:hypothetical protein